MKASDLKGLAAINLDTAEKVGTIEDLELDLMRNRVASFQVKGLKGNDTYLSIPVGQVQNLGEDALTFHSLTVAPTQRGPLVDPGPYATAAQPGVAMYNPGQTLPQPGTVNNTGSQTILLSQILNHSKMITDNGKLLGLVKDVVIEPANFQVTAFEVSEGGLFAKTQTIQANPGIRFGPEIAVIPENLLAADNQTGA